MADMMTFPNTVEEFMEQYKITDTEQIYTNGSELVSIFRMKQWFDHKPEQRWIPCSEMLPDRDGRYLVTNNRIGEWIMDCDVFSTTEKSFIFGKNVIAWMPLPEPYQEDES